MKTNQMRKAKAIYSEFATARESATITGVLGEIQGQVEEWEPSWWQNGKALRGSWLEAIGMGKL